MYLILMYLIPVTQFLNDVPTSDVSKSVTSLLLSGSIVQDPVDPKFNIVIGLFHAWRDLMLPWASRESKRIYSR